MNIGAVIRRKYKEIRRFESKTKRLAVAFKNLAIQFWGGEWLVKK
jgi:hypothetical protein